MSKKIKAPTVEKTAATTISISGSYYQACTVSYSYIPQIVGEEKFNKAVALLNDDSLANKVDDEIKMIAFLIKTSVAFIKSAEDSFTENNLVTEKEIEVPDELANED